MRNLDKTKEVCYDILLEIDRICKSADLKYFIYAGTLLGAVRHKGFIPWDDDIDIVMMREDYERFPEACAEYLDHDKFELQTIFTDPYASNPWMKLHNKHTAFISGARRAGAMEGVNIDIFPLDKAPDSLFALKWRSHIVNGVNFIYLHRFQDHSRESSWKLRLFQWAVGLIPPWNELQFKKAYDRYLQKYNGKKTENVVYLSNRKYMRKVVPRQYFSETVMLQFEDGYFPAPGGYEEILIRMYGKDYMQLPSEEQRISVHGAAVLDLEHSWKEYRKGPQGYEKI